MAKLLQVGSWIFDPADVKAVKVEGPESVTLDVSSIVPVTLIGDEATAFLAHYAKENKATVLTAGPIAIDWAPD